MNTSLAPAHAADAVSSTQSDSKDDALYRKVAFRLLPFLMLCYIAAFLDRVNVGFAKLQMLDELGFSEVAVE